MIEFDNSQAEREGWAIFSVNTDDETDDEWQLQRDDETERFPDDESAWRFVREKAAAGSPYHEYALKWLKDHAPGEYKQIMKI